MMFACTQISRFWAGLGSAESSQLLAGQRGWDLQLCERFLAGAWQRLLLGRRGTRDFMRRLLDAATFAE